MLWSKTFISNVPNWAVKAIDIWWIENINSKRFTFEATSNFVWVAGGRTLFDRALFALLQRCDGVEHLVLRQDINQDYKLMLSLKEDSMNTNFDLLLLACLMLVISISCTPIKSCSWRSSCSLCRLAFCSDCFIAAVSLMTLDYSRTQQIISGTHRLKVRLQHYHYTVDWKL